MIQLWIQRLVNRALPGDASQHTPEQVRQARLMVYLVLVITVAATSYSVVYVWLGMWLTSFGAATALFMAPLSLVIFIRTHALRVTGHMLSFTSMLALALITIGTGGLDSVVMAWSVIVPIIAMMLVDRRAGMMWLGVVITFFMGLWLVDGQPWMPASEVAPSFLSTYQLIVPIGLTAALFAITWSYESARDDALTQIQEANDAMRLARDQARREHDAARLVLDSMAQGLVLVRPDGSVTGERSAQMHQWFGHPSPGQTLWAWLGASSPSFAVWLELGWQELQSEWMPLALILSQLPSSLERPDQHLRLEYRPLFDDDGALSHLLVVMTDVTEQVAAQRAEESQRELMSVFFRFLRDPKGVYDFLAEADVLVTQVIAAQGSLAQERRWIHTLKGNSGLFGLHSFARWLHELEDELTEQDRGCDMAQREALSVRWEDYKSSLTPLLRQQDEGLISVERDRLDAVIMRAEGGAFGEEIARELRRWTWDSVAKRLELLAERSRTLAQTLGKPEVEIVVECASIWQPPHEQWRSFWSALTHVIRNALDHGLESPQERALAKKSPQGRVTLRAKEDSHRLIIEVQDDGRGIQWEAVARKAAKMGLPSTKPKDLEAALFIDGMSTRDEVSEISGRGVGMQAARESCDVLGGHVTIETSAGEGTTFRFVFPNQRIMSQSLPYASSAPISELSEVSELLV